MPPASHTPRAIPAGANPAGANPEHELPTISVIVLNYNGKVHLQTCLDSLLHLDYPAHKLELLLVDNASADGSAAYVRAHFPQVKLVETGANLGFAQGNNVGAQAATGEYVAFLNNDTRVEPDWLRHLIQPCLDHDDVVCTGSTMLDWAGERLDFGAGWMNFHGFAFQKNQGMPVAAAQIHREPTPIFFACGGAMLVRRDLFVETGGFDADHFAFYEDVDLGWRLWLMGYRVLSAPQAIAYHRLHATTGTLNQFRKWVLFERNALLTVLKNYDDANLQTVLPAALMLLIARIIRLLRVQGWDPESYHIGNHTGNHTGNHRGNRNAADDAELTEAVSRSGLAVLVAANEVVENLPRILERRRQIQARRKRPDAEIFARFGQPLYAHTLNMPQVDVPYTRAHYAVVNGAVVNGLSVADLFKRVGRRVLLVTTETFDVAAIPVADRTASPASPHATPFTGRAITEAAAWARTIGQGLAAQGHEALFAMPKTELDAANQEQHAGDGAHAHAAILHELAWEPGRVHDVVHKSLPDVIVLCDAAALDNLHGVSTPTALCLEPDAAALQADQLQQVDFVTPAREATVAIAQLDEFCRRPTKRAAPRTPALAHAQTGTRAPSPTNASYAPPKRTADLLREAYAHFRRGGLRGLLLETLGYLQRRLAE